MSLIKTTRADLTHVEKVVDLLDWVFMEYPEMFTQEDEDELKIVEQWLKEKLNEDTNI